MSDHLREGLKKFAEEAKRFLTLVAATALALFLIWVAERYGVYAGLGGILKLQPPTVNIEFRGVNGSPIDPGAFVRASAHNGAGTICALHGGYFESCDAGNLGAGALAFISVQDGLVKETLPVRLDKEKQILYVQSAFTEEEILQKINQSPD